MTKFRKQNLYKTVKSNLNNIFILKPEIYFNQLECKLPNNFHMISIFCTLYVCKYCII